jgi:hypothetical protein
MLERIPEPEELMDSAEQVQAYYESNIGIPEKHAVRFRSFFPGIEIEGKVLDLACGPATKTVALAQIFQRATFTAVERRQVFNKRVSMWHCMGLKVVSV